MAKKNVRIHHKECPPDLTADLRSARKPIDPPPIVEIKVRPELDPYKSVYSILSNCCIDANKLKALPRQSVLFHVRDTAAPRPEQPSCRRAKH